VKIIKMEMTTMSMLMAAMSMDEHIDDIVSIWELDMERNNPRVWASDKHIKRKKTLKDMQLCICFPKYNPTNEMTQITNLFLNSEHDCLLFTIWTISYIWEHALQG
jgi:hypothetical protein